MKFYVDSLGGNTADTHAGLPTVHRTLGIGKSTALFESLHQITTESKRTHPLDGFFLIGGDGEIRTLELFVAVTRFPIVRPRPD